MDSDFRAILEESNIKGRLIDHLEAQDITDEEIFRSLKSDELRLVFDRAGPLVSVGQFSLLCRLWERETGLEVQRPIRTSRSYLTSRSCSDSSSSPSPTSGFRVPTSKKATSWSEPSSPSQLSDPADRKELFERYKTRMLQLRSVGEPKQTLKQTRKQIVALHIGGMIFDEGKQCGVKKKTLPSPRMVDFPKSSHYKDIINKGRSIFFKNESDDPACYSICGPSGVPFEVSDPWTLEEFLRHHGFQPSKLRLYILYTPSKLTYVESEDKSATGGQLDSEITSDEETPRSLKSPSPCTSKSKHTRHDAEQFLPPLQTSQTKYTKPVVHQCIECHDDFLAPIPGTTCELPDGTLVCYKDPVLKCPECDEFQFGAYLNKDFKGESAT